MKISSFLLAILLILGFATSPAYACSIDENYVPPTTAERFKSAKDVVLASIQTSDLTKEVYESYDGHSGNELLTLKIEKVYKGERLVGDTFSITREYGDSATCLPSPLFGHLLQNTDGNNFHMYIPYTKPSLLLFLNSGFESGSKYGYVDMAGSNLSLEQMVVYSDAKLKDLTNTEPGLIKTSAPNSDDAQKIALMQQLIVLLTQYIELLKNK